MEGGMPTSKLDRLRDGPQSFLLDSSVARRIHEIDPSLRVEWVPDGIWWTPISQVPPGVYEKGAWRIGYVNKSRGYVPIRMWPPTCGDGRLVTYLRNTWGHARFIERSHVDKPRTKIERLHALQKRRKQYDDEMFNAWWRDVDHGEMHRASRAAAEAPKWRGNWNVPDDVTPAKAPA